MVKSVCGGRLYCTSNVTTTCFCTQGFTNKGNPGADAVTTAIAAEVKAGASLVLLNGDICYAECASPTDLPFDKKHAVRQLHPLDGRNCREDCPLNDSPA